MQLLRWRSSMKDIAKDTGTSVSGVKRVLGIMPVSRPQRLPQALSFDEFKGDTGGQPFQCIVADPLNRCVFDILPDRTALTIQEYLRPFPNRDEVKCVVMDMNRGFRSIARTFLPNAQIIIDRFHVVRCCTEAMENVRRSFQASLPKDTEAVLQALQAAAARPSRPSLRRGSRRRGRHAPLLGEACAGLRPQGSLLPLHGRPRPPDRSAGAWTSGSTPATGSTSPNSDPAARRWSTGEPYILNAFDFRLSNGFTEGCNNAIKTLKRVAFGFRSFRSFRARILLSLGAYPNF